MGRNRTNSRSPRRSPSIRLSPVQSSQILAEERKTTTPPSMNEQHEHRKSTTPISIPVAEDRRYAGTKFNSPPPAYALPKPPTTWISSCHGSSFETMNLDAMTVHLRQMLKVSAS